VAGAPADLVARLAASELSGSRSEAHTLRSDLLAGRWRLNRGQFQFYWERASRLSGDAAELPADSVALSEAAGLVWQQRDDESNLRRQQTVWIGGSPYFLLWRGTPGRHFVLVARPDSILKPLIAGHGALYALTDAEGRVVAGRRSRAGRAAVRTAAESQLPWTLYVTGRPALSTAPVAAQQKFLVSAIVVMVLFLILGSYFIARAIRREMEVSRIQSDFVAAVSHEFRSPLTSIRQLSEILALGRAPSDERRQIYYETLVRESSRLQRLVEALLNFGRMEAQGRQFRFEEVDTGALVEHVVSEFEPQVVGLGRHIELHGTESRCAIQADPEAIAVALRNLVDNAVKYSPECPTVWVEWDVENEYVAIRVRDRGPGIAESERKAIFRKFVRGTAAAARNVKGSGLGLAMVRHIVAAHRGQIRLASKPGQGSTFTMLLPVTGKS
jgi:signal transduction histidine kinase